jgi:hypothetical protein
MDEEREISTGGEFEGELLMGITRRGMAEE